MSLHTKRGINKELWKHCTLTWIHKKWITYILLMVMCYSLDLKTLTKSHELKSWSSKAVVFRSGGIWEVIGSWRLCLHQWINVLMNSWQWAKGHCENFRIQGSVGESGSLEGRPWRVCFVPSSSFLSSS
jgi:hypothetical protein